MGGLRVHRFGTQRIYVAAWPEGDRRSAISIAGGSAPRWSPTGEELFHRGDTQMMVAGLEI